MGNNLAHVTANGSSPQRFEPGDRVRIYKGQLAGLVGRCIRILKDSRCVIHVESGQAGISVIIRADALAPEEIRWATVADIFSS
jgi:transcription antitermination factor NusG